MAAQMGVAPMKSIQHCKERADDEAALLDDIRFALRGLDPWPPKGGALPSEDFARKVVEHLKLCGLRITRPEPKQSHSI